MQMITKPQNAEIFEVEGATVPFYKYTIGDIEYIEFDTSKCGPPEPMVNAMTALKYLKDKNTKVVMINHKKPMGLIEKIEENYDIEIIKNDKIVQLIFSYKEGKTEQADLNQQSCHG